MSVSEWVREGGCQSVSQSSQWFLCAWIPGAWIYLLPGDIQKVPKKAFCWATNYETHPYPVLLGLSTLLVYSEFQTLNDPIFAHYGWIFYKVCTYDGLFVCLFFQFTPDCYTPTPGLMRSLEIWKPTTLGQKASIIGAWVTPRFWAQIDRYVRRWQQEKLRVWVEEKQGKEHPPWVETG